MVHKIKNILTVGIVIYCTGLLPAQTLGRISDSSRDSLSLFQSNDSLATFHNSSSQVEKNTKSQDSLSLLEIRSENYLPKWYEMVTNLPGDWLRYYKEELTTSSIPLFAGITVLTAGLIATDDFTWKKSHELYTKTQFNRNMSDLFTEIGDGRTQFGLAAAYAAYGFIGSNKRALRTASQIVEAVLASGAVVQVIKHLTGRQSPYVSSQAGGVWRFFPNQILYHKHVPEYDAFPSGHIATSMAAFVVIAENYPEYGWIKPASYTLAALIGVGMANKGIHWYSDYPLGIALGYAFGKLIAHPGSNLLNNTQDGNKKTALKLLPYSDFRSTGVALTFHF
ncbi:MAG: phosphatase PAP2 family protein [Methanococcaceae archaeon]